MVSRISVKSVLIYSLIAILAVFLIGFTGYTVVTKTHVMDNIASKFNKDENIVHVDNVSTENMNRLKEGTTLSFGSPDEPFVNLIVTPKDLSRENALIGDKPSALLNAVKDKKILLNIYLVNDEGEPDPGINNIMRAASCNTFRDETPGKIATLSRIVENVDTINLTDDYSTIAKKMGIDDNIIEECEKDENRSKSINNSAVTTENNTMYFMQQFGIVGKPSYIIVNGQSADRLDVFTDDWVDSVIDKKPIMSMFKDDVVVKSANE